ncbi:MAG TPA: hypothetical protein VL048_00890 [Xanthobacteraceae bacterium]|jgi:hypothetical protein|nr:hypothetical protein [Xanthobacteraceae bacterium]
MLKVLFAVIALIVAAIVASVHFRFNPAIPIFIVLGFGLYMVGRIGGPALPKGSYVPWGSGRGIYLRGRDYVQDEDPDGGEDQHEGDGFR